jgi:hypothetical protein
MPSEKPAKLIQVSPFIWFKDARHEAVGLLSDSAGVRHFSSHFSKRNLSNRSAHTELLLTKNSFKRRMTLVETINSEQRNKHNQ